MTRPLLGLNLLPDREHLGFAARAIEEHAELLEITPETLWDERFAPTARHATLSDIARRSGLPVVGHGVGMSPGTVPTAWDARSRDAAIAVGAVPVVSFERRGSRKTRRGQPPPQERPSQVRDRCAAGTVPERDDADFAARLSALARDHAAFGFRWYSEHLGFARADGLVAELPLPLPFGGDAVRAVAARVARLAEVVPHVALENQAALFALDDPAREPEFLNEVCAAARCDLLLDLHNAYVQCRNFGLALDAWVDAIDLARVVEIHVSGGSESDPAWLASRRVFRLDSHDGAVPGDVWRQLDRVLPRCPNLRAVVLERNDGTLDDANVGEYEAEVRRLAEALC